MQFIDLHRQYDVFEERLKKRFDKILEEKHFIGGEEIGELEEQLRAYSGTKHVVACASGTDALTVPLMAYELTREDAVFVPSFTFFATGESVALAGGIPVFVDSDPDTFNMDPEDLKIRIQKVQAEGKLKLRGIVAVDLFGQPADYDALQKIADEHGMFLVEDSAQGFGGRIGSRRAGSFGNVAGTSFFPAKPLGCYGDGGAIFLNDDSLLEAVKSIHVHGQGSDKYDNVRIGLNSRLDTFQAAVLLEKLAVFDDELEKRDAVADKYSALLGDYVKVPVIKEGYGSSWAQYTIQLEDEVAREKVIAGMKEQGVPAMVYYPIPIHQSTAFAGSYTGGPLPVCEKMAKRVMSIPMHPYLTDEEIEKVAKAVIASL